ncbi:MAG: hypothetical protein HYS81_05305 [Candidatus Aenigmatarchaeota archaeon]|nr:MAG: hypothetical protein HYS81_05305 [Candidatus Aenigmarchaeota archaeon]
MGKGLSELVSAVLILAFAIAIAVIVSTFSTGFARESIGKTHIEGERTADCNGAGLDILADSIASSGTTLFVTVKNTGLPDLTNVDFVYRNTTDSAYLTVDINETVASGQIKTLQIKGISSPINRIIMTTGCPGITDTVENVSGTFEPVT